MVCHDNMIVFAKHLESISSVLKKNFKDSQVDLVLISDMGFRRQTFFQILLLEVADVPALIKDYLFSRNSDLKNLYKNIKVAKNKEQFLNATCEYKKIYIITSKYIFPESYTKKKQIFNIHCGLLPSYRGIFPTFWSYLEGNYCGVSLHKIDSEIDRGEVLGQYQMNGFKSYYRSLRELYSNGILLISNPSKSGDYRIISEKDYYRLPSLFQIIRYRWARLVG